MGGYGMSQRRRHRTPPNRMLKNSSERYAEALNTPIGKEAHEGDEQGPIVDQGPPKRLSELLPSSARLVLGVSMMTPENSFSATR